MDIASFTPDNDFFDNLILKFSKQLVNLDYHDMAYIRKCEDLSVFDAHKESECESDTFVKDFLEEVYKRIEGKKPNQVLVCIGHDTSCPILMETMSHLNTFCDNFDETTEIRWGIYETEENEPMRLVVAVGNNEVNNH